MRREPTKEEMNDFLKRQDEVLNSPAFDLMKKTVAEYEEKMSSVMKYLEPTFARMVELKKSIQERKEVKIPASIFYSRPVEYDILDELKKLNKKDFTRKEKNPNEILIIYKTEEQSLERSIDGRIFSYDLTEDGKRKKMLDLLVERTTFVKTKEIAQYLRCPTTQAVAKVAQTFNDYAKVALHLKKIKLIEGKQPDGYRINPKIVIEKL